MVILIVSLPLMKYFGDSLWLWIVPTLCSLALTTALSLSSRATPYYEAFVYWFPALLLLLGFRYRRWAGLTKDLGLIDGVVLLILYAVGVGIATRVVPIGIYTAGADADPWFVSRVIGAMLVGGLPLAAFWLYSRLKPLVRKG